MPRPASLTWLLMVGSVVEDDDAVLTFVPCSLNDPAGTSIPLCTPRPTLRADARPLRTATNRPPGAAAQSVLDDEYRCPGGRQRCEAVSSFRNGELRVGGGEHDGQPPAHRQ